MLSSRCAAVGESYHRGPDLPVAQARPDLAFCDFIGICDSSPARSRVLFQSQDNELALFGREEGAVPGLSGSSAQTKTDRSTVTMPSKMKILHEELAGAQRSILVVPLPSPTSQTSHPVHHLYGEGRSPENAPAKDTAA